MLIGILEPSDFSPVALHMLSGIGDVEQLTTGGDLREFVADKEVLFIRLAYRIDKELLQSALNLRYICSPTTGLNHIDVEACEAKDIKILCLKGEREFLVSIRATPEHTFGLVLALLRNYASALRINTLDKCNRDLYKGEEIYNSEIGIIGFGRIGKRLAEYFSVFDASAIHFYDIDPNVVGEHKAIRVDSIETLISKSNMIFLCASYTEGLKGMIDSHLIDCMWGKYFINTARGELVDEPYLLEKIRTNWFKGVAIDVIANETEKNSFAPFLEIDPSVNFLFTPHIGGATYTSMHRTEEFIASRLKEENIKAIQ